MSPTRGLLSVLIAVLALGGCKKHVDAPAPQAPYNGPVATNPVAVPPAALPPDASMPAPSGPANYPPPPDPVAPVSDIELGSAIGNDHRISTSAASFSAHDTVHATVMTSVPSGRLETRWTYQDGSVVHSESRTITQGPMLHEFHVAPPGGWASGHYRLDVLLDGKVTQSKAFDVR